MKRILVLSLALILAVSSLAVPSYAAEVSGSSFTDLLTGVEFDVSVNGEFYQTVTTPYTYVNNATTVVWEYDLSNIQSLSGLVLNVISDTVPTSIRFSINGSHWGTFNYVGSNGKVHQYYKNWSYDISDDIILEFNYSSAFSGFIGLDSFFGIAKDSISVSSISYFSNAMCRPLDYDEYGQPLDGFLHPVSVASSSSSSLPITVSWCGPSPADDVLDYGEFFGKIPYNGSIRFLDSCSILFYTCSEVLSYGASLTDSSGNVISGLTSDLIYCGESQMVFEMEENFERVHLYILNIDLVGFDTLNNFITFDFRVDKAFSSSMSNYEYGYFVQIADINLNVLSSDRPWYTVFAGWLGGKFTNLISSIESGFNKVGNWFTDQTDELKYRLNVFRVNVKDWFTGWFDTLFELLSPDADSDGFQDQVDDQGDRLDQMDDVLSSVTKPALDRVDTNISGIVSDTDLANTAHVYTYIIDDNIMAPALTMVTILAMMSFALFGKR